MTPEQHQAENWWASLSINQMKALRDKHEPHKDWYSLHTTTITTIWHKENKPEPQPTIPT